MLVAFRVDASIHIGTGHVMRCLTLAEQLRKEGANVLFISRELVGNLNDFIYSKGFEIYRLSPPVNKNIILDWNRHAFWLEVHWQDDADELFEKLKKKTENIDWLVVDHYALDKKWEQRQRKLLAANIMVIDDLADRSHDCDILLDQNFYETYKNRYENLVSEKCLKFLGPNYVLLRPEFIKARNKLRKRDGSIQCILIFFGGIDLFDLTSKALESILLLSVKDIKIHVVVGRENPHCGKIKKMCETIKNSQYHCQIDNIAELMSSADIGIGGGGSTIWEYCFLGLPSIVVTMADNQVDVIKMLSQNQCCYNMGTLEEFKIEKLLKILDYLHTNSIVVSEMSKHSIDIMKNYCGVAEIVKKILKNKDDFQ